jgi:hypothetical protein
MDRFSTRLAGSIIDDRHREAAEARLTMGWSPRAPSPSVPRIAAAAGWIVERLGRPFGLRSIPR